MKKIIAKFCYYGLFLVILHAQIVGRPWNDALIIYNIDNSNQIYIKVYEKNPYRINNVDAPGFAHG